MFINNEDRDRAVDHEHVVHYVSIGVRCTDVGMIVKEKGAQKEIVYDVSAHTPGVDVDPILNETGKEQGGSEQSGGHDRGRR